MDQQLGGGLFAAWLRRTAGFVLLVLAGAAAQAQPTTQQITAFDTNCGGGCHTSGAPVLAPKMLSDGGTAYGRILSWRALSFDNPSDAELQTLATTDGLPIGAGMLASYITSTALADLRLIHTYLRIVRDTVMPASIPDFNDVDVNPGSPQSQSITISNYRRTTVSYAAGISGTRLADFEGPFLSSNGTCASGVIPAATDASTPGSCTISVRFKPLALGTLTVSRVASLDVTLTGRNNAPTGVDINPVPSTRNLQLRGNARQPLISVLPTTLSLSAQTNFSSDIQCSKISNTGNAALGLTGITITQPVPAPNPAVDEYELLGTNLCPTEGSLPVCTASTSLDVAGAPTDSCKLAIRYTPKVAGSNRNGSVSITHTDTTQGAQVVTLNGTASPAPVPVIDMQGVSTLPFGERPLGGAARTLPLTIKNGSTQNAVLTWSSPRFEIRDGSSPAGAVSTEFTIANGTCSAATLAAQASCAADVSFAPTGAAGSRTATLRIFSDASNNPVAVTLTGSGATISDAIVSTPAPFADTVVGVENPDTRTVLVENPRPTNGITYTLALGGTSAADFIVRPDAACGNNAASGSVAAGQTCTLTVAFKPTAGAGVSLRQASLDFTFAGTSGDPAPPPVSRALSGQAIGPLRLSATTLNFTAQATRSNDQTTVLSNAGVAALTLTTLAFEGAFAGEYTVAPGSACSNGTVIAAGASCDLIVRFAPQLEGTARNATLRITHSAVGSSQTVDLRGTATAAPQGRLVLSATSISYPDTQLNSSVARSLTLRNVGDKVLTFSAFELGGAAASDYTTGGTCSTANPLAVTNGQCTLTVTFRPTQLGSRSATLTVRSDSSSGPATITLSGSGVPIPVPQVSLVPETPQPAATLAFGDQTVGGIFPSRRVRLSNSGTADLAIASITVQGSAFSNVSATACPATLAPSDGCDIDILFTPAAAGTSYTGTLRVTSNAAGSPHSVALTGRGTAQTLPVLAWSPAVTRLDFGDVVVGSPAAAQTATLLNQGPGGVTLTLLNAIGTDAAAFPVANGTCRPGLTLFEGQTCTVSVSFAPATAGAKSATVQVASTGSFPPVLALAGTGLGGPVPGLEMSVATLNFGTIRVGAQSVPGELVLSSTGSGSVQVTDLAVTGPFVVQPKSCPSLPFALPAGSECSLTVQFVPAAEGDAAGTLRITSNADPSTADVALAGSGEAKADLSSGGGCSIAAGDSAADPTLWALVLLALALLIARRRARRRP